MDQKELVIILYPVLVLLGKFKEKKCKLKKITHSKYRQVQTHHNTPPTNDQDTLNTPQLEENQLSTIDNAHLFLNDGLVSWNKPAVT